MREAQRNSRRGKKEERMWEEESSCPYSDDGPFVAEAPRATTWEYHEAWTPEWPVDANPTKPVCIIVRSTVTKARWLIQCATPHYNAWGVPEDVFPADFMSSAPAASGDAAPAVAEEPPAAELAGELPASSPPSAAAQMGMAVAAVVPGVLPAAAYVAAFTAVYPVVGCALNQGVDLMLGALPRSSPATNALQTAASTTGEGGDAPVAESAQVAAGRMFANSVASGVSRWTGQGLISQAAGGLAEAGAHLAIGTAVNLSGRDLRCRMRGRFDCGCGSRAAGCVWCGIGGGWACDVALNQRRQVGVRVPSSCNQTRVPISRAIKNPVCNVD